MDIKDKSMIDSSGRFRTDKNFKNTILKNCSRLRQRSTDDNITRPNKIAQKINNIKRISNYRKMNSLKIDKLENKKDINNISKDNISIDLNLNVPERKTKKILHSNIRKAFLMDFNSDKNKEKDKHKEKEKILNDMDNNDSFIKKNGIKVDSKNKKNENSQTNINYIKSDSIRKTYNSKNDSNTGIQELIIDINENTNSKGRIFTKRSNSIRKIMNSLYYHSYTTEKKEKNNINNSKSNINNNNSRENRNLKYSNIIQTYKNKNNFSTNTNTNNEKNINIETKSLNTNSNCSYIYKKKNRKFGNIYNSNNLIFNTYSTQDNSFIISDSNMEMAKKNIDNQKLIKVKIVYRKPQKAIQKSNENSILDNAISYNQTVQKRTHRRKILFERKKTDDNTSIRNRSKEKVNMDNLLTPIVRNNKDKLLFSTKDITYKNNDINNFDNNNSSFENNNYNFIIEYFDDIIELCNGIEERTIFEILTKNNNKKYIIDYNQFILEKNINDIKDNFTYCFKYFCIILITFYFLSKDEILYKYNSVKIHLLFIQYIYSSLCYVGYQDLNSKNIKRFFKDYHFKKKVSIIQCTTSIIKLLFDDKEEYNSLNNVLKQLMVNARTTNVADITKIINQTILFCFNQKAKMQNPFPYLRKKSNAINNIYNNYSNNNEDNNKITEKMPVVPYIKTTMRKKFCLVLDLDETISHSLKLNFGYYFLLRPGVIEFLTELSEFYEIIIFTSSPKIYADSIIDKIDEKGNLISHRLYKSHVIFEKGKSVKKLNLIGRDLNKIIFVDNLKSNAKYNPNNLYLIPSWTDDIYDDELFKLRNKLKYIYTSGKFNDDITKGL